MAGNPADLTIYADINYDISHTYYGNGCTPSEYPGKSGSTTPCSSRLSNLSDGEKQKNGTYYNFQATVTGSGGRTVTSDNINIPDTFCPLGWQLPYGGTGGDYYDKSRSWKYLFTTYSITNDTSGTREFTSYPLSFSFSGAFYWDIGELKHNNSIGLIWSGTNHSIGSAYRVHYWGDGWDNAATPNKYNGGTLRCTKFLASLHRRHGGRKSCGFDYLQR